MQSIERYAQAVEQQLTQLTWSDRPLELYDPIRYILSIGGKRLRPALTLLAADMYGDWEQALPQACALEMFHNFTLVHDDIMDEAPLRRGKATVHHQWDVNTAILSGDALLIAVYQQLLANRPAYALELIDLFNRTALEVCEGQQLDMLFETRSSVEVAEYIEMIRLKTSVLVGCALQVGGMAAGASEEDQQLLYKAGVDLGIAFQVQDDYLDAFGDPEKFGKQVGGDILSNKKTLLLLSALERARGTDQEELQLWLSDRDHNPQKKVQAVKGLFERCGVVDVTREVIQQYFDRSLASIQALHVGDEERSALLQLAERLVKRDH